MGYGHAVLVTEDVIEGPFAVINADDFYGSGAFVTLGRFLRDSQGDGEPVFAVAGFRLAPTLSAAGPVSRGLCRVNDGGWLEKIVELPELSMHPSGATYIDDDGVEQLGSR